MLRRRFLRVLGVWGLTKWLIGLLAIGIGYSLLWLFWRINKLNEEANKKDRSIGITALRVSFWAAILGIVIIILGLLFLMEVIPWQI